MSDLISRQAAIDACMNGKCANIYDCAEAIEKIPSAEPKRGEWILCGNRLPDKDGEYLVTTKKWNGLNVEICSFDKGDIEKPFCPTNKNSKCSAHGYKASTIIAWMPLPKPYYGVDTRGENK